jgi:chitobiase/beta-hexosaminidase-like protein
LRKKTTTTHCAKPTLTPSGVSAPVHSVTVRIATATMGAYLRYTLDGSTPTGEPSGHGTKILVSSGKVTFAFGARPKTLKAIAYKAAWTDSLIAVGEYAYEAGGNR